MSDHYFDLCCHGIPWCHCGCDDPGFDDDFDEDDLDLCPFCGEPECDASCTGALVDLGEDVPLGPTGRDALGGRE